MSEAPEYLRPCRPLGAGRLRRARTGAPACGSRSPANDSWDVTIKGKEAPASARQPRRKPRRHRSRPTPAPGRSSGEDLRGGMEAYGKGRLRIRHNLHLGVGFLAATSGHDRPRPARVPPREDTARPHLLPPGGHGRPRGLHPRPGRHQGQLPPDGGGAGGRVPGDRPRPPRLRRQRQADRRPLRRRLLRRGGHRVPRRAGHRQGLRRRQQHGRPRGARARLRAPRPRPQARAAGPLAGLAERQKVGRTAAAWSAPSSASSTSRRARSWTRSSAASSPAPTTAGPPPAWTSSCARTFNRADAPPSTPPRATSTSSSPTARTASGRASSAIETESLFVWGKRDRLVPISFARHVEEALPHARHVELDCGHVPQVERPAETHRAVREFFATKRRRRRQAKAPRAATA